MAGSCLCKRYDLIWIVERDVYDTLVEIFIHLKTDDQRVVKQTVWLFQPWCSVRRQLWTLTRTQPPPDTINKWPWVSGGGQTVAWEIHLHPVGTLEGLTLPYHTIHLTTPYHTSTASRRHPMFKPTFEGSPHVYGTFNKQPWRCGV